MQQKEFFRQLKKESKEFSDKIEDGFCVFCLKIYFPDLTLDEIENSLFGLGGNDESIDSFIINHEQKEMHFSQFKASRSLESMRPLKKEWLSYFFDIPQKLENYEYISNHKNLKVKDIAADYNSNKSKFDIYFHFFHIGYNPNEEIIDSYSNLRYYDLDEIKNQYLEYQSKKSQTEPKTINLSLNYDRDPDKIEKQIGKHRTFVSMLTGDEIVRLREEFKYNLFDKNLRFSLGNNKINKQIVQSALNEKESFYFYNNGLTITSTKFKFRENTNSVRVDSPQIINGAQTVNAIYAAFKQRLQDLKRKGNSEEIANNIANEEFAKLSVLFRIIQNEKSEKNVSFERTVIECNNTQNAIRKRDFYANAPEQIELQKQFAKEGYFYEIKRGERDYIAKKGNKHNLLKISLSEFSFKNEKLNIEELASLWMAYNVQGTTSKEVGKDFIFGNEDIYELVFPYLISEIDTNLIREMILAYNLYNLIEKEAKIYRGVNSIMNLLNEIEAPGNFDIASQRIKDSVIFNNMLKKKFDDLETFKARRETYTNKIKNYSPISSGKYVILATFKLIIDECGYLNSLIGSSEIYKSKQFIRENIVKSWLPTILDSLLIPEYKHYMSEIGGSVNAFYHRPKTYESIKDKFESLEVDKDKSYDEIFELRIK